MCVCPGALGLVVLGQPGIGRGAGSRGREGFWALGWGLRLKGWAGPGASLPKPVVHPPSVAKSKVDVRHTF